MKSKFIILLFAIVLLFASLFIYSSAESIKLGDINKDGSVNALDARKVLRVSAKLDVITDADVLYADVNFDTKVNALDARLILRASAKLETLPELPDDSETVHKHNYSDATCTSPKTCSCGATEGEPNGHMWNAATYTSPKTCSVCGETEGNALPVPGNVNNYHGHVYTGGENSKKYHYEAECAGKYSHEITWDEVDRRNLGPCGTCVLK